jgi:putative endonuclease
MAKTAKSNEGAWWLYLLECESSTGAISYYTGITTDVIRRFNQHLAGVGARYTRSNPPLRVIDVLAFDDRASASRAETLVKRLKREEKPAYFAANRNWRNEL